MPTKGQQLSIEHSQNTTASLHTLSLPPRIHRTQKHAREVPVSLRQNPSANMPCSSPLRVRDVRECLFDAHGYCYFQLVSADPGSLYKTLYSFRVKTQREALRFRHCMVRGAISQLRGNRGREEGQLQESGITN
jgi:hypothetical protein